MSNIIVTDKVKFDGSDYEPERDNPRLTGQLKRVVNCMLGGEWKSLRKIERATGDGQASVSAQLRHLRKERFGKHKVEKRYSGSGLYEYKLTLRENINED